MKYLPAILALLLFSSCAKTEESTISTPPSLFVDDLSISEGESVKVAYLQIILSEAASQPVTVVVSTRDGSATAGEDYQALNDEMVSFNAGEIIKEVKVTILGDSIQETDEEFFLEVNSVSGAAVSENQGRITIVNDDQTPSGIVIPQTGFTTPLAYDNWDLIWQDEFQGNELNTNFWSYEYGTGSNGWGNNESQYYREENTTVQDGYLIIEARKQNFGGMPYTSSRIITKGAFDFQYGRVDIRAALPYGQGIWPALWMLGSNFNTIGWPACGEIDIMEIVGHEPDVLHGTAHWSNAGQHASYGGKTQLPSGTFNDQFHVFSIIWNESQIRWYLNNQLYHTLNITPAELSEFHEKFFLIFNVAVGGNWPGYPDATTTFPQRMIVDYVRVFQPQ